MPKYSLTYFDMQSLAEPIRLLLSYGNIEFIDNRINNHEDFSKLKAELPMGQVPILEVDGKVMYQSLSICRYLARQVGLAGSNAMENYEIDNIVDTINELREKLSDYWYEVNPTARAEKLHILISSGKIDSFLGKLDAIAAENGGYFALKKLTWADVYFTGIIRNLSFIVESRSQWALIKIYWFFQRVDITKNYPNLRKVIENTEGAPGIKEWIARRPISEFTLYYLMCVWIRMLKEFIKKINFQF